VGSDAWLVEQLRCELASDRLDLAGKLAFLSGQLQDASGDRAQREHAAAELWITSTSGSCCCEPLQQPRTCERPQLAAQRLGRRDQQVSKLAKTGALGVHCSFSCGHQRLQRLAFTARPWRRRPLLGEHTPGGTGSVERVGLTARATFPPQSPDLEHALTTTHEEARETGTERPDALNRDRAPPHSVLLDEPQSIRIPLAARGDIRLEDDCTAEDVHNRERMRVTVRVDTHDVVQLICKHP